MKRSWFFCLLLLFWSVSVLAQANGAATPQQDDDFAPFLLVFGVVIIAMSFAAVLLGTAVLIAFLLALFAMVSAGVLSTGILIGMQRRSVAAGFRTVLAIASCLGGVFVGATGAWLIVKGFHLHWQGRTALLAGGAGGAVGGLLLGLVVFYIIRVFLRYCRQRLSF
jgi:hypothetical protein